MSSPTSAYLTNTDSLSTTNPRRYVAVAGNIGAGKSSLVDFLCRRFGFHPYFEPNDDNPYLDDFYGDMARYAFHSQVYFLGAKYQIHRALDASPHNVVQDRTIWEDAEIFVENLRISSIMDERDYATYRTLYESIRDVLRPPDLMIYLHCNTRTIRRRIKKRGRSAEQEIPLAYIKRLQKLYDGWIEGYTLSPLIAIPTDRMDYVTDIIHAHELIQRIEEYL